jgi:hypothetical protein
MQPAQRRRRRRPASARPMTPETRRLLTSKMQLKPPTGYLTDLRPPSRGEVLGTQQQQQQLPPRLARARRTLSAHRSRPRRRDRRSALASLARPKTAAGSANSAGAWENTAAARPPTWDRSILLPPPSNCSLRPARSLIAEDIRAQMLAERRAAAAVSRSRVRETAAKSHRDGYARHRRLATERPASAPPKAPAHRQSQRQSRAPTLLAGAVAEEGAEAEGVEQEPEPAPASLEAHGERGALLIEVLAAENLREALPAEHARLMLRPFCRLHLEGECWREPGVSILEAVHFD